MTTFTLLNFYILISNWRYISCFSELWRWRQYIIKTLTKHYLLSIILQHAKFNTITHVNSALYSNSKLKVDAKLNWKWMQLNLSCPFICYSYKLISTEQWCNINKNGSYLNYIYYTKHQGKYKVNYLKHVNNF